MHEFEKRARLLAVHAFGGRGLLKRAAQVHRYHGGERADSEWDAPTPRPQFLRRKRQLQAHEDDHSEQLPANQRDVLE